MTMNQAHTPLFDALVAHAAKKPLQFHIPGHKCGAGMDEAFRQFIGDAALSIDLINIAPLDDLHQPSGIIHEAQRLAADAFGAEHAFFSVQGTSGAIQAMIMAVCRPGDKIILPRNVHKSVMSAIIFSGARPVFLSPTMDETFGIAHGISTRAVQKALERHPDAKAVFVINPTYFGICANLHEIVTLAHAYRIPVLVDEAHGVHIHFHEALPCSAMQAGADMAATSVHKLGGSLTQSSVLNVQGSLVDPKRVQTMLSMLTTTSTSYLLLASLDAARRQLALHGRALAQKAINLAEEARRLLCAVPQISCLDLVSPRNETLYDMDPTKLTIHVRALGMTGFEMETLLRKQHGIEVEMSDMYNILCIITPADTPVTIHRLIDAIHAIAQTQAQRRTPIHAVTVKNPHIPTLALVPRDAFYALTESIPLEEADGRIIAEFIMVYPPGIPILLPGEVISQQNIAYIQEQTLIGLPVQGLEDKTNKMVKVIVEQRAIEE